MEILPIGSNLLVSRVKYESSTASGLILGYDDSAEKVQIVSVIAFAPEAKAQYPWLEVGVDLVVHPKTPLVFQKTEHQGQTYQAAFVKAEDVVATVAGVQKTNG